MSASKNMTHTCPGIGCRFAGCELAIETLAAELWSNEGRRRGPMAIEMAAIRSRARAILASEASACSTCGGRGGGYTTGVQTALVWVPCPSCACTTCGGDTGRLLPGVGWVVCPVPPAGCGGTGRGGA